MYIKSAIALFVLLNPLSILPIFLAITDEQSDRELIRTARIASITVAVVLSLSALFGQQVLLFFGIRMPSFQVGGGILLLLIGLSMVMAKRTRARVTPEEQKEAEANEEIAIVPLGVPMIAGPGVISTAIIYDSKFNSIAGSAYLVAIICALCLLMYYSLRLSSPIVQMLGRTGINTVTRLMGVLLVAMSVEFMAQGLRSLFPGLAN